MLTSQPVQAIEEVVVGEVGPEANAVVVEPGGLDGGVPGPQ
jgi:hypothetical protein